MDIEQAGEVLVMAATLIEIKSRSIAPPERASSEDSGEDAPGDPRDELIRQLLAYQRIRAAGEAMDSQRHQFGSRIGLRIGCERGTLPSLPEGHELEDVHSMDLADAYERIAAAIDFDRLGDHVVELDDTPIALYEQDLLDRLNRRGGRALTRAGALSGQPPV